MSMRRFMAAYERAFGSFDIGCVCGYPGALKEYLQKRGRIASPEENFSCGPSTAEDRKSH